ncbi:protein kinase [Streptomyces sp. NBC_00878]|uniref:protein kinase domain-containing protein n=1 Tax=Streptomyces sp. NBC_00878 TaxID=2975854 RepID=UPI00224D7CC1|nr:protein kinase [Streptomyces sp. NBC_00878]MCX4910871.1 protein kinase [Streptomyces sp. NBC_00878]
MAGGSLDRQPPMSPVRAARIGAQLADASTALHEAGIVHCDVKPANVGRTRRGTAKLLDFGAAYRVGGTETITANGPFSFTPDYAAPELVRGNVPRPASAVFCLATTLYALVTSSPPRGGDESEEADDHRAAGKEEEAGRRGTGRTANASGTGRPSKASSRWTPPPWDRCTPCSPPCCGAIRDNAPMPASPFLGRRGLRHLGQGMRRIVHPGLPRSQNESRCPHGAALPPGPLPGAEAPVARS